jgi:hypothetical protein
MTSSSPTPDIASLSLASSSPHQRLHDNYDYDGNVRTQYHFATSPPVPSSQASFNPLNMNQSPLKSKPVRAALPSVCAFLFFSPFVINQLFIPICDRLHSNGSMAVPPTPIIALSLPPTTLIFPRVVARHPSHTSMLPRAFLLSLRVPKTRLYPPRLSSKTSLLMSNARPFWTSSYVHCPICRHISYLISIFSF